MTTDHGQSVDAVTNIMYAALRRLIDDQRDETVGDYRFHAVEAYRQNELTVTLTNPSGETFKVNVTISPATE
jgi:hypothetical protein